MHSVWSPEGRHYKGVAEAVWPALIFGGGWAGSVSRKRSIVPLLPAAPEYRLYAGPILAGGCTPRTSACPLN